MKLSRQKGESPFDPSVPISIPMMSYWIGTWELAINRRLRAPEDLARQYDAASGSWSRTARRFQLETAYLIPSLAYSAATVLAEARSESRVLDHEIETGSLSIALGNILPDPIVHRGIDVSSEMLAAADVEMRHAGMSSQLEQADILSIPHADESFDVVMAAHVLEHLLEPQRALTEMIRVLKPGGVLFVCMTRRSAFGTLIQVRWRTWTVTERQGTAWLRDCQLNYIGFQLVSLGSCAGRASTAFWAQKPVEELGRSQIKTPSHMKNACHEIP